jgi:hypothetical protein
MEDKRVAHGNAADIWSHLNHPILDGDGHWIDSVPVLVDYLRSVAGADVANRYAANQTRRGGWYQASQADRARRPFGRGNIGDDRVDVRVTGALPEPPETRGDLVELCRETTAPTLLAWCSLERFAGQVAGQTLGTAVKPARPATTAATSQPSRNGWR